MNIQTNIPLSTLTTMKIGGNASYVAHVTTTDELKQVYERSAQLRLPVYVIGGGSNLIAHDDGFKGIIAHMEIKGAQIVSEDGSKATISVYAGEIWDDFVKHTVAQNLSGIEAMSGIPGTVGAAPVQNIGAYGQELADTFVSLEAYDTQSSSFVSLSWQDCGFSYRHSIFRGEAAGRYVITRVTLALNKSKPEPPFYDALQKYLDERHIAPEAVTVQTVREAVLAIRGNKLPDPAIKPNAGSFFKNPIVEKWKSDDLLKNYDNTPTYPVDNEHVKIPAGWLIEAAELKGEVLHGFKVHDGNAVVLVNQSATSYADLDAARQEIKDKVRDKFQIVLEQEPLELASPVQ